MRGKWSRWETIMIYAPDFYPIARILSNGIWFFLVTYGKMERVPTLEIAIEGLGRARYWN
jgi:hypothetical protein